MAGSIHSRTNDGGRLEVAVVSDQGAQLVLTGDPTDVKPSVTEGSELLGKNPALVSNAWAFGKLWYDANTRSNAGVLAAATREERKIVEKEDREFRKATEARADHYAKTARWIADVADDLSQLEPKVGWCSSCFTKTAHLKSNRPAGQLPVYVCQGCGSPTLGCVAPGCPNMAVRERGAVRIPMYCAEHRHGIPGFEKSQGTIGELHDYEDFLAYDQPDLSKATKIAAVGIAGLALGAPLALFAAPAIGGAIGSLGAFGGLTGAAATAHGLALLGGGSLAAGGLGMAGGTAVVTAVGAAVGGSLGASVSNAYVREDKSFRIELLRPGGGGVPVVVANGFLTDGPGAKWGGWKRMVDARYPDSPVYRVHWGAKELKDLGIFLVGVAGKAGGAAAARTAAALATKVGAKVVGRAVAPALVAVSLAKNPWHVAKSRADKTGVIVGDLLARTGSPSFVLIGHSLGARVVAVAAQVLGTKHDSPRLEAVHLLGAAIGAKGDWTSLAASVDEGVYTYYSGGDNVLRLLYKAAQGWRTAAGQTGFVAAPGTVLSQKIVNVDVSGRVSSVVLGHFEYQDKVDLR
ncbi:MAG: DUF726 domain-containing protein [Propionicimonas sp.]|nr:DUF726 domain-containing protein [Propionicimonas sp.]